MDIMTVSVYILTFAIFFDPFCVNVLSLRFMTLRFLFSAKASARAVIPSAYIPFWGMAISSREPKA